MKNIYFDRHEFLQILSLAETNPLLAKEKYEEYLERYPNDYCTYCFYCSLLITLQKFDEAEKEIIYLENMYKNDKKYVNEKNRRKQLECNILYTKIKLLCYRGKYQELYELYLNNYQDLQQCSLDDIYFYCKKQLGKLDINDRREYSYLYRQIIEYHEDDFLDHVRKHLADINMDLDNPNKNVFVPEFDLNKVLKEIKKYIPSTNRLCLGFFENIYIFKLDNCGRENNKLVNYFKVVCFNNTSNIITMVPVSKCENLPFIDLNYLIEKEEFKVKRLSQTEKFYKKYKNLK